GGRPQGGPLDALDGGGAVRFQRDRGAARGGRELELVRVAGIDGVIEMAVRQAGNAVAAAGAVHDGLAFGEPVRPGGVDAVDLVGGDNRVGGEGGPAGAGVQGPDVLRGAGAVGSQVDGPAGGGILRRGGELDRVVVSGDFDHVVDGPAAVERALAAVL